MKACIDLIEEKVTKNLLHVCKECVNDKEADKIGKAEKKEKETTKEKQNIREIHDKFTSQLSKLFKTNEEMQQEDKKLKKKPKTYAAATGQNNPGKSVVTSEKKILGIRIGSGPNCEG